VNRAELETRVLAAIDAVRRGERVEDDIIECKRVWPDPQKAFRQLAGSANQAAGEPIIWIIGVDEATGLIYPRGADDPADWWARVRKRFDQDTVPDLLCHATVHVGVTETVVALAFGTDAAPYMVTLPAAGPTEREVPIRDGTRTRSAHRHELLRMLAPAVRVPPAELLKADVSADWRAATAPTDRSPGSDENTHVTGSAAVYLAYTGREVVVLPIHRMRATLSAEGLALPLTATVYSPSRFPNRPPPAPPPPFGVVSNSDSVVCTGPGKFIVNLNTTCPGDYREQWAGLPTWQLDLDLGVVNAAHPLRLRAQLHRRPDWDTSSAESFAPSSEFFARIGRWSADGGS